MALKRASAEMRALVSLARTDDDSEGWRTTVISAEPERTDSIQESWAERFSPDGETSETVVESSV